MRVAGDGLLTWYEFGNGTETKEEEGNSMDKGKSKPKEAKMDAKKDDDNKGGEEEEAPSEEKEEGSKGQQGEIKGKESLKDKSSKKSKSLKELLAEMNKKASHRRRLLSSHGPNRRTLLGDEEDADNWWDGVASPPSPHSASPSPGDVKGDGLACALRGRESCTSVHWASLGAASICPQGAGRCVVLALGEDQGLLGIKTAVSRPDAEVVLLDGEGGGGAAEVGRVAGLMGVKNVLPCARRMDEGEAPACRRLNSCFVYLDSDLEAICLHPKSKI